MGGDGAKFLETRVSDISFVLEMSGKISEHQAIGVQVLYDVRAHLRVRWTQDRGL